MGVEFLMILMMIVTKNASPDGLTPTCYMRHSHHATNQSNRMPSRRPRAYRGHAGRHPRCFVGRAMAARHVVPVRLAARPSAAVSASRSRRPQPHY